MSYTEAYFDEYLDRRGTNCFKWDGIGEKFNVVNPEEIIPMWIADMDFRSPREVIDTIVERAQTQAYGYTIKNRNFLMRLFSGLIDIITGRLKRTGLYLHQV